MDKKEFRKKMLQIRSDIDVDFRHAKSMRILDKIINHDAYINCEKLFCFINMGAEVETINLINKALDDGKIVAVPYAVPKSRVMVFIEINSLDGLIKSKYGVSEPPYMQEKIVKCDEKTLIIVPGLAFDKEGYRIGYGGGYYDTFIEANPAGRLMGVAFSEMSSQSVPRLQYDKPVHYLVTDEGVYRF